MEYEWESWHYVEVDETVAYDAAAWCLKRYGLNYPNPSGVWRRAYYKFRFKNDTDAFEFKMRWQ